MMRKEIRGYALVRFTPVLCSCLFVSMAYGPLIGSAGLVLIFSV